MGRQLVCFDGDRYHLGYQSHDYSHLYKKRVIIRARKVKFVQCIESEVHILHCVLYIEYLPPNCDVV